MVAPTTTIDRAGATLPRLCSPHPGPRRNGRFRERRGAAWVEILALFGLASTLVVSAAVVGPRLIRAGLAPAPVTSSSAALSAHAAAQHETLDDLLASAGRVLSLTYQAESSAQLDLLVFWVTDDRFPGVVNLSELLVLRYSPVLRSLLAFTWTPATEDDAAFSVADLRSARRIEALTGRSDVVRAVIAQPLTSCEVTGTHSTQPLRPDTSPPAAAVRLTWLLEPADTRQVSTIVTDLRWVILSDRF